MKGLCFYSKLKRLVAICYLVVQLLNYDMILAIDTSALLAVLLNEEHKKTLINLTKGHDLQAPFSLDAEVGNALCAMFKQKRISLQQGRQVVQQFKQIPIRRTKLRLGEAVKLANHYSIYAYDAYVLDCSMQYHIPLLTLDKKMIEVAQKLDITVLEVTP